MNRRDFLKTAALSAVGVTLAGCRTAVRMAAQPARERMPTRPYGSSGERLSVIGFGGILVMGVPQERADQLVAEAVARGVNYFDVAPQYGDAEERLGPALEPYRQRVFLAGKTLQRRREGAAAELERTLRRLRTDHLDLYQLHALTDVQKDVEVAFGRGGAMELCLEAQADGRVRHLGFSAHSEEAALAALERYPFDSILFPVNAGCWYGGGFGPRVVAAARKRGTSIMALKALAWQRWPDGAQRTHPKCWYQPIADRNLARLALRFTLSQPVTALIPPGDENLFRLALDLVSEAQEPLTGWERRRLRAAVRGADAIFRRRT